MLNRSSANREPTRTNERKKEIPLLTYYIYARGVGLSDRGSLPLLCWSAERNGCAFAVCRGQRCSSVRLWSPVSVDQVLWDPVLHYMRVLLPSLCFPSVLQHAVQKPVLTESHSVVGQAHQPLELETTVRICLGLWNYSPVV